MADSPKDQGADPIQPVSNTGPEIITEPADDDVLVSRGEPEPEVPSDPPPLSPEQEQQQAIAEQMANVSAALSPSDETYEPYDRSADPDPTVEASGSPDVTDAFRGAKFDPRYRDEFDGLLFIGSLSKSFTWMDHTFVVKTIGTDEALAISLVIQPWSQTQGEVKAYQAAAVAAALVSVDGKTLPHPITRDITPERLRPRFEYVMANYQPVVIDMIYGQIMELENKVVEVLAEMGKASG